jgi:hypothetical protein
MKIDLAKSGYRTFSKNISEFVKINEMPIPLDIRRSRILFDIVNNNQKEKYEKQIDTNN